MCTHQWTASTNTSIYAHQVLFFSAFCVAQLVQQPPSRPIRTCRCRLELANNAAPQAELLSPLSLTEAKPRNLCRICEVMSTISELSSRVHDDHDIRNVELLSNLLSAATNYWVLPADTLQANEPHQPGPPTLSPDLRAHPLHQMPRTIKLTATYYACEGAHQRSSVHHHHSSVGPLLGETSSRFPTTFLVTPDRSVFTDPPFPQQTLPPGTQ